MKTKRYFNNKRKHYFALGGGTNLSNITLGSGGAGGTVGMQGAGGIVNTLSGIQKLTSSIGLGSGGIGGMLGGGMGGVANGIATGLNNLMNPNGNETGIGNALSAVGSPASNIPGVGGIIGAGVNLVGGVINSAFGSNINEEFVKDTENKAQQQAHYDFSASDNSGLLANYANYRNQRNVTKDEVGSEGWFSNAATNKTKELNALIDEANRDARASFTNTALNLDEANDRRAASNYFDEGGSLNNNFYGSNTITPIVDFGAINDAVDANFKGRQRVYPLKRLERGHFKNPKDLIPESPVSDILWGLGETLTPLGPIMGILDVDRDINNIRESPSITKDALMDTAIDAVGILPAGKSLKRLAIGAGDKLRELSEAFTYTTRKGQKKLKQGINDVRRSNKDLMDAATDAALARSREDAYKTAMKARNRAKGNDAKLDALEQAVNPNIYNYNMFQKVGSTLDGINDIFGIWDSGEELMNEYKDGGGIHIKKKNRGKFTSYCGGKVTSECIARGKRSSSPTIRKRAVFAQNARKFKHAYGGPLFTQGGVWSNGVTFIDNGGTHEQNPYDGVQMGVDNQGIPNLVEEGEVVWNDYVFSNRLKPSKEMKKKNKYKGTTFADIAKEIQKESEERPNDWISNNGLEAGLSRLAALQEGIRERKERRNMYPDGGKLNTYSNYTDLTDDSFYTPEYMNFWNWINNNRSDSRAQRWLDRINSEEFGTVGGNIFNFDDIVRLAHDYKRGPVHNAFALAAREFANSNDNPNNRRNNLRFTPDNWELLPEDLGELRDIKLDSPKTDNTTDTVDTSWEYSPLRYAPIVGNGLAVLSDIFSKPDYSAANMIADVPVNPAITKYNPVGEYLTYRPLDRNYYTNQLRSNAAANRRAIMNTSGGNRAAAMAGLLASDYNFGNQLGQLARQAEEYNNAQRERVAAFNRETDLANSRMGLQTNTFNAESRNQATARRLAQTETVARMRQAARDAYDARRSNNLNLLLNDLGNLGREITDRNWLDSLAESGVLRINTKGEFSGNNTRKHGGKLNKKKKGGWRYA